MTKLYTTEQGEQVEIDLICCLICCSPAIENLQYKRFVNCSNQDCEHGEIKLPRGMHFNVWNHLQLVDTLKAEIAELKRQLAEVNLELQDAYDCEVEE